MAKHFEGPKMFIAAAEETGDNLVQGRGDAYCGMLNASYNLKLRNVKAYIPEYPVGDAKKCAEMIHEFAPIAKVVIHCGNTASQKLSSFEMKYQMIMARTLPEAVTQGTLEGDIVPGDIHIMEHSFWTSWKNDI